MAASSSQSQENTKDLLIYVFYDVDYAGIFAGKHVEKLNNTSDMFPKISERDFFNEFGFYVQKTGESAKKLKVNMVQFRLWVLEKNGMIMRHDETNNVDVVYIWSSFIANHEDPVYQRLMTFLMNRSPGQPLPAKTFVYMVKFCHNINYFRDLDGLSTLQNLVDGPDDNDINLFKNHKTQVILNVFVDNYFRNTGYTNGDSIDVLNRFLHKLNVKDENDTNPCFIVKQHDVNVNVVNMQSINKYTDFMFLPFETYTSDVYSDYQVKTASYPLKAPTFQRYTKRFSKLRAKLTEYERRINEYAQLLNQRNIENNALRDALNTLTDELEEKRNRIEELERSSQSNAVSLLESDLMQNIDNLQREIGQLKANINKLRDELRDQQVINEQLEARIAVREEIIRDQQKTMREMGPIAELGELKDMYNTLSKEYREAQQRIQDLEVENASLRIREGTCANVNRELREEIQRLKASESSQESSFELVTTEQVEETFGEFGDISVISEEQEAPGEIMSPEESSSSEVERLEDKLEHLEREEAVKTQEIEVKQMITQETEQQLAQLAAVLSKVDTDAERNNILLQMQALRNKVSDQKEDIAHTKFELYNQIILPKEDTEEKLVEAVERRIEEGEESSEILPLELSLEGSSESFIAPEETEITFKHREETLFERPTSQLKSSDMNSLFGMSFSINSIIMNTQSRILSENVQTSNHLPVLFKYQKPSTSSSFQRTPFQFPNYLDYLDS